MTFVTDSITYNVHERGRKARGVDRHFDTVQLAALINSASVQEQVKHGDMFGYFGHWPRQKFGMVAQEGAIVDGKAVSLPVAIRTVELSALDDGTIKHRVEFLDTEAGIVSKGLFDSKAGGFSSAITPVIGTSPTLAKGFHGFDYVYEPNYTTNRGHKVLLDAIGTDVGVMLDAVLAQAAQAEVEYAGLFDSLHTQHLSVLDTVEVLVKENKWLIARLSAKTGIDEKTLLDSVLLENVDAMGRLKGTGSLPDYGKYREASLAGLSGMPDKNRPDESPEGRFVQRTYGVNV